MLSRALLILILSWNAWGVLPEEPCEFQRVGARKPEVAGDITLGELRTLMDRTDGAGGTRLFDAWVGEMRRRHADSSFLTPELVRKTIEENPRVFDNPGEKLFTPNDKSQTLFSTLRRFAGEIRNRERFAQIDRDHAQTTANVTAALTKLRAGEEPPPLDDAVAIGLVDRFSIGDLRLFRARLLKEGDTAQNASLRKLLDRLWSTMGGEARGRPHEGLFATLDRFDRQVLEDQPFRDGRPDETDTARAKSLATYFGHSKASDVPEWTRPVRTNYDPKDKSKRVLTLMHQVGADFIPELARTSDRTAYKTHTYGQSEVDPWIKDHLPIAVPMGSGKDAHYVLLHYNDRQGARGYFNAANNPGPRPPGLPEDAKAFEFSGYRFWAVPKGTDLKFEGGNFQKTKGMVFVTKLVARDNPGRSEDSIREELGKLAGVPKDNVVLLESVPGERTGHVDLMVRVIDYEKNIVAVPEIPPYMLKHLGPGEKDRRDLAGRYNEYLDGIARQLAGRGVTVKRMPMTAPEILVDGAGRPIDRNHPSAPSASPFGVDVRFHSTVNFSDGPNGLANVPIALKEFQRLTPDDQKKFHAAMVDALGARYFPLPADTALSKGGGAHCLTWTLNAEAGRVSPVRLY